MNEFTKGFIKIKDIDETFCQNFKTYLTIEVSNNTAHTYFSKLKTSLNKAIKDRIISYNPTTGIRIKKTDTDRQFLIDSEIKKLINTKFDNHRNLKNAFLFSCFTGLRLSDIKVLKYEQIQSGYLKFRQVKTKGRERIKLSVNAINILEKQKELTGITGKVFDLPANVNITLRIWIEKAGIKKHITFHSARHTFATLCLTHDIDLYTVSKLLGHRSITATQIYAKLIDKKKDEAIDKLPIF